MCIPVSPQWFCFMVLPGRAQKRNGRTEVIKNMFLGGSVSDSWLNLNTRGSYIISVDSCSLLFKQSWKRFATVSHTESLSTHTHRHTCKGDAVCSMLSAPEEMSPADFMMPSLGRVAFPAPQVYESKHKQLFQKHKHINISYTQLNYRILYK